MRKFIAFWWLCLRMASQGNSAFANDWQWLFGIPACSGLLAFFAGKQEFTQLSTGYPIVDALLVALGAFIVTWLVAFAMRVLNAPVILYHEQKARADLATPRIEILFPERCNSPGTESAFKRSWSPLNKAGGSARRISLHTFYVGIQNPSNDKTLRNVRLLMESVSLGPGQVLNMSSVCARTQTDSADIPPGGLDYFLIGEGTDETDDGMFRPEFMMKPDYDALMATVDGNSHSSFRIRNNSSSVPLLKNNGYTMEIVAYADDMPSTRRVLTIDAKDRIAMHLSESEA
jgi:hypothetical protein